MIGIVEVGGFECGEGQDSLFRWGWEDLIEHVFSGGKSLLKSDS